MQTTLLDSVEFPLQACTLVLSREGSSTWLVEVPEEDILYYYSYESAARKTYDQLADTYRLGELQLL